MESLVGSVGLAAGITSIVSVIGRSVLTLNNLRQRYKGAEFNIILLAGHLHSVRVALHQVQRWVSECLPDEPQHHPLIVDLHGTLGHCGLLVEHIDKQISRFQWDDDDQLNIRSKVLAILDDQATKDYLSRLDHQINALNLCLSAFRCRTPFEQRQFLERDESRKVLARAKDDTTSLIAIADSASFSSSRHRMSVESLQTRFSKTFDFDEVLLAHKVYQKTFRSMLRRAASPATPRSLPHPARSLSDTAVFQLKSTAKDSAKIDWQLKQEARRMSKEVKILAMGSRHGRSSVVKQIRLCYGEKYTEPEMEQYRRSITALAVTALIAVLDYVDMSGTGLVSKQSKAHAVTVRKFAETGGPAWVITEEVANAVKTLWHNWHVRQAFSIMQQYTQTAYYLSTIERICQPDYQPSTMDIIRAPEKIDTLKETNVSMDHLTAQFIEYNEDNATKILFQFAGIQFCLFTVDLTCYDQYLDDRQNTNALQDRLSLLKAVSRSAYFAETIILLILTNASAFANKLASSPLSTHFSDYGGGNDVAAAKKYILKCFRQVHRSDLVLFSHFYDYSDEQHHFGETAQFFTEALSAVSFMKGVGLGNVP